MFLIKKGLAVNVREIIRFLVDGVYIHVKKWQLMKNFCSLILKKKHRFLQTYKSQGAISNLPICFGLCIKQQLKYIALLRNIKIKKMSRHQKRERFSGKSRITDVTISGMAFVKKLNIVFGYMIL